MTARKNCRQKKSHKMKKKKKKEKSYSICIFGMGSWMRKAKDESSRRRSV